MALPVKTAKEWHQARQAVAAPGTPYKQEMGAPAAFRVRAAAVAVLRLQAAPQATAAMVVAVKYGSSPMANRQW